MRTETRQQQTKSELQKTVSFGTTRSLKLAFLGNHVCLCKGVFDDVINGTPAAIRSTPRVSENAELQLQTLSSPKFAPNNTTTNLLLLDFKLVEVRAGMMTQLNGICF